MKDLYPTFDINTLSTCNSINEIFSIDRFSEYIVGNPKTTKVHRHAFYHVNFFVKGVGENIMDFKSYEVVPGSVFLMRPGQVHNWTLNENVEGYVVNFSSTFFDQLQINSSLIDQFPFFNLFPNDQMIVLSEDNRDKMKTYFEDIISESSNPKGSSQLMIAAILLQIFALADKEIDSKATFNKTNYNSQIFKRFTELIESNFQEIKLPKDYAALLNITPNQLNFICKQQIDLSSGEIIRNRIILEAKRLLVNFDLSIAAIAEKMNYFDTSNFVKFFKKYTGFTPEAFRKEYYSK